LLSSWQSAIVNNDMPIEIEAKMKVDDLAAMRQRLRECGADRIGEFFETNMFFDTRDRALLARDQGLRLRQKRDLASQRETVTLTFKGPRQAGQLKSREECELDVGNARDAINLLDRLGYQRVLTFEKKRQSWRLDDCAVELDELPHLGTFVEIEGPSEDVVLNVRQKLALSGRPHIAESYIAMLAKHLERQDIAERVIEFSPALGLRRDE
jgi:adenylate cyclase class 2